jgi:hypothetical protein
MISPFSTRPSVEPLEARIAPALLVNGANLLGGAGNPYTGETSVGENAVTLVKVLSGQALVWFDDGHIYSISFAPNTSLEIHGDIHGDVVGNLNADGTLSDSNNNPADGEDGNKLLANNLIGLKTVPLSGEDGSLGNIITGGSIGGLSISGQIFGAYAGDGVFRAESDLLDPVLIGHVFSSVGTLDINPVVSGAQTTFDFTKAGSVFQAGASIKTGKITRAPALQLFAGSGNPTGALLTGAGPAGGSITGITIESAIVPSGSPTDTPSYWLIAGDGAGGKTGGAGGSIDRVIEKASFGPVIITGGQGGAGTGGAGGAGGTVSFLDLQSSSAHYTVTAGNGGNGAPAGDGGKLLSNNFANRTPVSGIILSADFTGDGIDDILVVDAATGQMIINTQDDPNPGNGIVEGGGSVFHQLVQFKNQNNQDIVLINPNGVSPADAVAMDFNGDGLLDIVVAYKNSSSLSVFLNQGKGVFFDPNLGTAGDYATVSFGLGFSPTKIATNGGQFIAIAENRDGKGLMHYGAPSGSTVDDLIFTLSTGVNEFSQPVADIVYAGGQFITAFTNGVISKLQPAGLEAKKAFVVTETGVAITGGISDLEVDSTGHRLLVLSSIGHSVNVFDIATAKLLPVGTIALSTLSTPLVAHFVHDANSSTEDDFAVLASLPSGTTLTAYRQDPADSDPTTVEAFRLSASLTTANALKNFVPAYTNGSFLGDAALAGSMSTVTFTADLIATTSFALPFASKIIEATAGDGGKGLNLGKLIGKGGAGGGIIGINADGNEIKLHAGQGGASEGGPAGDGGSVSNPLTSVTRPTTPGGAAIVRPPALITASGATVTPALVADVVLEIEAGNGGTPTGLVAKTASGGAGGSLIGLSITLDSGPITLTTGTGGNGNGANGGAGGNFNSVATLARDGSLALSTGKGGDALAGVAAAGAGGSIINFAHELALDPDVELLEKAYAVTIVTGGGGASAGGLGGAGGSLQGVSLKLDGSDRTYNDSSVNPPLNDANKDSTVRVSVTTGDGGQGANGGAGGSIRDFSSVSVFDQKDRHGHILLNYVVMNLTAGKGGIGTAGAGGAGGGILLTRPISGVTYADPDAPNAVNIVPFTATAGAGVNGTTKGGAGGSVTGLVLQNSPFADGSSITTTHLVSAVVIAGTGGIGATSDGGAGGSVSGALIGTQLGFLAVTAGAGGDGGAAGKGGAGGSVVASNFGVVKTVANVGLSVVAGKGGAGTLGGGLGGSLANLQVSTPQSSNGISALLYAGDGGAANALKAVGGKGGDVTNLTQGKDVNSSINLIQAGNGGGNLLGAGGAGGNLAGIKTVGFIGRPSDGVNRLGVFDTIVTGTGNIEIPQGLFSGRGGDGLGAQDGLNGSVTNVSARQIAAIAAAYDSTTGLFAAAAKVSNVKAALIGFDLGLDGAFDSTVPGTPKPSLSKAIDGFILSATPLTQVTGVALNSPFVFIG